MVDESHKLKSITPFREDWAEIFPDTKAESTPTSSKPVVLACTGHPASKNPTPTLGFYYQHSDSKTSGLTVKRFHYASGRYSSGAIDTDTATLEPGRFVEFSRADDSNASYLLYNPTQTEREQLKADLAKHLLILKQCNAFDPDDIFCMWGEQDQRDDEDDEVFCQRVAADYFDLDKGYASVLVRHTDDGQKQYQLYLSHPYKPSDDDDRKIKPPPIGSINFGAEELIPFSGKNEVDQTLVKSPGLTVTLDPIIEKAKHEKRYCFNDQGLVLRISPAAHNKLSDPKNLKILTQSVGMLHLGLSGVTLQPSSSSQGANLTLKVRFGQQGQQEREVKLNVDPDGLVTCTLPKDPKTGQLQRQEDIKGLVHFLIMSEMMGISGDAEDEDLAPGFVRESNHRNHYFAGDDGQTAIVITVHPPTNAMLIQQTIEALVKQYGQMANAVAQKNKQVPQSQQFQKMATLPIFLKTSPSSSKRIPMSQAAHKMLENIQQGNVSSAHSGGDEHEVKETDKAVLQEREPVSRFGLMRSR